LRSSGILELLHGVSNLRRFYQNEWLGLKLVDVSKTSLFRRAGIRFYDSFYQNFFAKYNYYDDLPKQYVEKKLQVAKHLLPFLRNKSRILSIGCGIGLVEKNLADLLKQENFFKNELDQKMVALEPSKKSMRWMDSDLIKPVKGFFPAAIDGYEDFDFAYAILLDYSLDDFEYLSLLKNIVNYGITEVYFAVSVGSSLSFYQKLKEIVLIFLSVIKLKNYGQFWGYLRTLNEHLFLFKKAGFSDISSGQYNDGQYWIYAKL
jgi:SAM-dependent methyltransferase